MDTYADDLATLVEALDLEKARSRRSLDRRWGGGPLSRSSRDRPGGQGRAHRRGATADAEDDANPGGLPIEVFDGIRAGVRADRSQFFKDLTLPFYGFNRAGAKVSEGVRDSFWLQGMMAGHKNALDCIKAFSETDFTKDLERIDVPTLIMHGDDDQIVPIGASAIRSAATCAGRPSRSTRAVSRHVHDQQGPDQLGLPIPRGSLSNPISG